MHVKGSTDGKYHHVALIENTNSSGGTGADNGLAIKLAINNPDRYSNFITFYDINEDGTIYNGSLGAIEGQVLADLDYDSDWQRTAMINEFVADRNAETFG